MIAQEEGTSSRKINAAVSGSLTASKLFVYLILLATIAAIVVNFARKKQTYYVDAPSGQVTQVFPLSEPNVTPSSLINWVTQAVTSAHTLDFYGYKDTLNDLKQYFTVGGYQNFVSALNASGSLKKIINERLIVSAVTIDTAVILQEGVMNGVYSWKIQVPLLLNYQGASTVSTQKTVAVSVLVVRVPTNEAPKGIGIEQLVDEEYNVRT